MRAVFTLLTALASAAMVAAAPTSDRSVPHPPGATFPASPPEVDKAKVDAARKNHPESIGVHPHAKAQVAGAATTTTCSQPLQTVYEWSNPAVSSSQRAGFINAMHCLTGLPARSGRSGATTRWEDFAAIHRDMGMYIHGTDLFLPWHRYFLLAFRQELRNACSYTGPMLWWNETRNAGNFQAAPMMTSQYAGSLGHGYVTDGIFKNLPVRVGDAQGYNLFRDFDNTPSAMITQNAINTCYQWNDFAQLSGCLERIHNNGHNAIGGVMGYITSSPEDPMFWIHHFFVDHMWRIWETYDPTNRAYYVDGTQYGGQPVTLNTVLSSFGFFQNLTVGDVTNTPGPVTCYRYDA